MRSCRQILTGSSVQKYYSLAVFLLEITVSYGITERKELQAFSEWISQEKAKNYIS